VPQVIIGLGNPGPEYRETRHNVGHHVVECVAKRLGARFRRRGSAMVAEGDWAGQPVYLAKPVAYMNVIGQSVARLLRDLELDPTALILAHDDLDLPFGRVRVRHKGRHGGHNGVRSVIEALGTEQFCRVKVGVGRPMTKEEVVDWVLSPFAPDERRALPAAIEDAADAALQLAAAAPEG
jgi:PTH1 family peptidyl-tRNA hydrolase